MLRLERFRTDDRAIEGLPIRLVIALVVGVASLGVMMNMLSGVQGLVVTELDARPSPDIVGPGEEEVEFEVVDSDGTAIADATVVVKPETATLDGISTATTDETGMATVTIDPELGPNQQDGTLEIDIRPPPGSQYADQRGNTDILVIRENTS